MNKPKILIVEDESIIAINLKENLIELGYEPCGITPNRCRTLKLLEDGCKPDLILMDIYLSGPTTGIVFAKELRQMLPQVPVIFLTANSEDATIKEASDTFAYGYILKPYKKEILKANIEIALNKAKEAFKQSTNLENIKNINQILQKKIKSKEIEESSICKLKFNYLYDKNSKILYHGDKIVKLTGKETNIIDILCKNAGGLISQDQIEYSIWQDSPAGYAAFRSILYRLRSKLDKGLITNKNNLGYRIEIEKLD
jgi:DNA-binding response OmpR family regulator